MAQFEIERDRRVPNSERSEKSMSQSQQAHTQPGYPPSYGQSNLGIYPSPAQSYPVGQPSSYQPAETYQPPTVQAPEQKQGWCARNQMNKPQSNAVGAGVLIFLSGGMSLAVTVDIWTSLNFLTTTQMRIAWPAGVLIGIALTMVLYNFIPKKLIMQFASLLVIIGGILGVAAPDNMDAFLAGRYLIGIANGMVFAPTLVLVGEVSIKGMRGLISSSVEAMGFSVGFFLHVLYSTLWSTGTTTSFSAYQLQGILCIVYGVIAVVFATFLTVESPVALLVKDQDEQAIEVLRKLQVPYIITTDTYTILEEHKRYVALNRGLSLNASLVAGLPTLLRLTFYRVLNILAISTYASLALIIALLRLYAKKDDAVAVIICYGVLRFVGVFVAMFLMDTVGRKKVTLFGFLVAGGFAIGVGYCIEEILSIHAMNIGPYTCVILLLIYQFFAALASTASSAYLSEAFPLAVKPYFISLTFFIEIMVLLIICAVDINLTGIADFFYVIGSLSIVFCVAGIWLLPETKLLPLVEAQQRFEGCISSGFN